MTRTPFSPTGFKNASVKTCIHPASTTKSGFSASTFSASAASYFALASFSFSGCFSPLGWNPLATMLKYSDGTPAFSARVTAKAVLRFTKRRMISALEIRFVARPSRSAWKLLPLPLAITTMRTGAGEEVAMVIVFRFVGGVAWGRTGNLGPATCVSSGEGMRVE